MAIKVKDPGASQAKYVTNASNAVPAYKAGIASPKQSQSGSAIAAIPRWQQAVQSPNAAKAMAAGLTAAGDAGWANGAMNKGANNYPAGITRGKDRWLANTQPFLAAIASVTLPDKGIRGSAANIQRVAAVAAALHTLKLQRKGGS